MFEKYDEWQFMQQRAAQLFAQGDVKAAFALMETINREQVSRLEEAMGKYERIENC